MKEQLKIQFRKYFGIEEGGVDLLSSIMRLPQNSLDTLSRKISNCKGRIFFMGNGGSYDNARWMAQICRENNIPAKVPGMEEDYIITLNRKGYESIFAEGLKADSLNAADLVVGLSGSGNSQNILMGFELARSLGAEVFALGGRDGGKMLKLIGSENCLIAQNSCMEAIEDLHNFAFQAALASSLKKISTVELRDQFFAAVNSFCSEENIQSMSDMAEGMIKTALNGGRTFILGTGIGANHFRADMGRGATNALPIRGVSAPEVFTMNSLQATANDDGTDFILADGLVKYMPSEKDFAVLCPMPGQERCFEICEDILAERGADFIYLGEKEIFCEAFDNNRDLLIAMAGHACGKVINEYLNTLFEVRSINCSVSFKVGQKKLSSKETLELESRLKNERVIHEKEMITFCYGNVFAVSSEVEFVREYY